MASRYGHGKWNVVLHWLSRELSVRPSCHLHTYVWVRRNYHAAIPAGKLHPVNSLAVASVGGSVSMCLTLLCLKDSSWENISILLLWLGSSDKTLSLSDLVWYRIRIRSRCTSKPYPHHNWETNQKWVVRIGSFLYCSYSSLFYPSTSLPQSFFPYNYLGLDCGQTTSWPLPPYNVRCSLGASRPLETRGMQGRLYMANLKLKFGASYRVEPNIEDLIRIC